MKRNLILFFAILGLILSACANRESTAETIATQTADPCSSANMSASIKPVNDLQREFDDASLLASNVSREQLQALISEMQRIRRAAQDQAVPSCLATLKSHQLAHMKTVIDTMIAFVGGADTSTLNNGVAQAGQEHDLYTLEMARLLGLTLVPVTNAPTPSGTQSP